MDSGLVMIGLAMIYAVVHFFFIQKKAYTDRTDYEKVVTWVAIICITLIFMSVMFAD